MKNINFGKINKFIIFGGGNFVLNLIKQMRKADCKVVIFTSKRYLDEIIDSRPFSEHLDASGSAYYASKQINSDLRVKKHVRSDVIGLSIGAPWIFNEKFIKSFGGKLINMHGTRLPQNRGGGGFSWQIMLNI